MPKIKAKALVPNIFDKVLLLYNSRAKEDSKPIIEMEDEEIVKRIQKGESSSFQYIVDRYQGKLFSYIMRLINNREEAHDITQDVLLKSYRNLHRFDTDRKFSSWIYRIAHNESVNWLKKHTRVRIESLDVKMESGYLIASTEDIENEYKQSESDNDVRDAIENLPQKYRRIMEMRYLEQLSYQEISDQLEKPINTVGTLINRAKKQLAKQFNIPV